MAERMDVDGLMRVKSQAKVKKGRGFVDDREAERLEYDSIDDNGGPGPMRSIEGWIVFVTGVHEEAQEGEIQDKFSEDGEIRNIHVNLDRGGPASSRATCS